jgi:mannose-6-phosphate isomerase
VQSIFKFRPVYKVRPWGGWAIARVGRGRRLPAGEKIGESWEIVDRPDDESVIAAGELKGKTLRWLLDKHGSRIMGRNWPKGRRFPLLIKILDCAERLSLQVHPPVAVAHELDGEPKEEMWYLLDASPGAAVLAGLRKGTTRAEFEERLVAVETRPNDSTVRKLAALVPRIAVGKGDVMVIPSGRLHAIDAGCLILEIQQNSDTTYRVFDWGRVGLDGRPRALQVPESLRSIDFEDFEPAVVPSISAGILSAAGNDHRLLVDGRHFRVEHWRVRKTEILKRGTAVVIHLVSGEAIIESDDQQAVRARTGETLLLAAVPHRIRPSKSAEAEFVLSLCPA